MVARRTRIFRDPCEGMSACLQLGTPFCCCVAQTMTLEVVLPAEALVAERARVRLHGVRMQFSVAREVGGSVEAAAAVCAHVGLNLAVNVKVLAKGAALGETLLADIADEWFLTNVGPLVGSNVGSVIG